MLKMYIGYAKDGIEDCAVLIFAHNSREARNLAFVKLYYMVDCEFIEVKAKRLWKDAPHLIASANKKKLENDIAHVIDDPGGCDNCGYWGEEYIVEKGNDVCNFCVEDEENEIRIHGGQGY